jgi:hypothetical protein
MLLGIELVVVEVVVLVVVEVVVLVVVLPFALATDSP